eukprot:scaffold1166_cov261-Pinguiococcus_pyrenoidosus.AAC.41
MTWPRFLASLIGWPLSVRGSKKLEGRLRSSSCRADRDIPCALHIPVRRRLPFAPFLARALEFCRLPGRMASFEEAVRTPRACVERPSLVWSSVGFEIAVPSPPKKGASSAERIVESFGRTQKRWTPLLRNVSGAVYGGDLMAIMVRQIALRLELSNTDSRDHL